MSDVLGVPFSNISAKPVGEFLAGFIAPKTPEEAQAMAVMAAQPGIVEANFRNPAIIKALRKTMSSEMKARGPASFTMKEVTPGRIVGRQDNIPFDITGLENPATGKQYTPEEFMTMIKTDYPEDLAHMKWEPPTQVEEIDPNELILRGTWWHGMSRRAREKIGITPVSSQLAGGGLARAFETGFPRSHHTPRIGEPAGVSLSMLPTVGKNFAADEYIHRVLPLFGDNPSKKVVNLMTEGGRAVLNDAYDKALNEILWKPGQYETVGDKLVRELRYATDANYSADQAFANVRNSLNTGREFNREFNALQSQKLMDQGYRGMLYNPYRGGYSEYELLMFDPKHALPLDFRRLSDYAPKRLTKGASTEALKAMGKSGKEQLATPGVQKGLGKLETGGPQRLGEIYQERSIVDRLTPENKQKILDAIPNEADRRKVETLLSTKPETPYKDIQLKGKLGEPVPAGGGVMGVAKKALVGALGHTPASELSHFIGVHWPVETLEFTPKIPNNMTAQEVLDTLKLLVSKDPNASYNEALIAVKLASVDKATQVAIDAKFPGKQAGGPVEAGKPYIVGEAGEEFYVPGGEGGPWLGEYGEAKVWQPGLHRYGTSQGYFELKNHPTHSSYYDAGAARAFIAAAKRHGVDPVLYTALGISESRLGQADNYNLPRINLDAHSDELEKLYGRSNWFDAAPDWMSQSLDLIDFGARYLASTIKRYPGNLLKGVQAYSGVGRKAYGGTADEGRRFFGKDIKDINFWRDKPQAKRVLEIYELLKKDPQMERLLKNAD